MGRENEWKLSFISELERAEKARLDGNEGMARVCARRAAGIVASAYLRQSDLSNPGPSAYDQLRYLKTVPELSPAATEVIGHFLLRINVDHQLPVEADLIEEARWLARELLT
jgi:hypothetical protein